MSKRVEVPKVNAGSMADIAFLLLIFFLVTTSIETDMGIDRNLPHPNEETEGEVQERNLLDVRLDGNDQLLVDEDLVSVEELRELAVAFLDNGGALKGSNGFCDYCKGSRSQDSSDNPDEAIISLSCQRETGYAAYIAVQNELVGAYNQLRNRESQRLFKEDYTAMVAEHEHPGTPLVEKERLKKRIGRIWEMYPMKIAEVKVE
ncbi:MAG: biopolymer transporter ExbD [Bacteroidota bacterium]